MSDLKTAKLARNIKFEKDGLYGPKLTVDIDENDYFIDCYKKAAKQTLEIIGNKSFEYHKIKNIIAFLGDRGQGKTSMMRSYVNALEKKNKVLFNDSVDNYEFITLDIVDPSTFEDCSNVLDVVLGQLLDRIKDIKLDDFKNVNLDKKNALIQKFNKLYAQINIIKDKSLLNRNLEIYEGAIETLTTVNDVVKFKSNLFDLIEGCLDLLSSNNTISVLIIPIDDIDIDLSNCYETVETIRKYLNLPNVLIVMAAKLEQLHEGIRLENMKKNIGLSSTDSQRVYEDIYNMATKYLLKLLPQNRRIHIPNLVNDIGRFRYDTNYDLGMKTTPLLDITAIFSEILYKKTRILILCDDQVNNYILNGNLRDTIDLLSCLNEMEEPKSQNENEYASIYLLNLEKFKDYFLNNWCTNNLKYKSARLIRQLYSRGGVLKNQTLIQMVCELIKDESDSNKLSSLLRLRGKKELYYDLSDISYHLNKIENHNYRIDIDDVNQFVYAIKMCYTIIMNQLRFIDNLEYRDELDSINKKDAIALSTNITIPKLVKFIGGRTLKSSVLNHEKEVYVDDKSTNLSKYISQELIKYYKNNKNIQEVLLLSTTSYDLKRDIYFYNYRNYAIDEFYFDPCLFFFNTLDINYTIHFLENDKGDIFKDLDKSDISEMLNIREDLELVARTVLCNFQLYDFFIDYLDIHYLNINKSEFSIGKLYIDTKSWLLQLKSDLINQNYGYFIDAHKLIKSINVVTDYLSDIIKLLEPIPKISFQLNSVKNHAGFGNSNPIFNFNTKETGDNNEA